MHSLPANAVRRTAPAVAAEDPKFPKRDAEVERETGSGWGSLIPNPQGLIVVASLGLVSYFGGDTALGRWLSEPPIQKVAVEQRRDDAGTPFGPSEQTQLTGGLGVLVAYNLAGAFLRPKLQERARQKAKAKAEAEAAAAELGAGNEGEGTGSTAEGTGGGNGDGSTGP